MEGESALESVEHQHKAEFCSKILEKKKIFEGYPSLEICIKAIAPVANVIKT